MLTHDDIQACLATAFPADTAQPARPNVALVARLQDAALQLPTARCHIVIPDCHLLTPADARVYPNNHFMLDEELGRLCAGLRDLKAVHRGELTVWHIGDLFDIWRARGGRGPKAEVDRIAEHYATALDALLSSPPRGCRAELLAGNHDYALHNLDEWNAARFEIVENDDRTRGDVLFMHGDAFEWIERAVPQQVKAFMVRLATWVSSGRHDLDQDRDDADRVAAVNRFLATGDQPIGVPQSVLADAMPVDGAPVDLWNVVAADEGDPQAANKHFYEPARLLALELRSHGHDIRLVVVGHTHFARIVRGDRGDGVPFALLDCGAWFGQCRLSPTQPWLWSAQVGVVVGDDLRVYQLGRRPA
jgi:UDP-2,3-diacylglucosamine pyrophosphatase LpxH